MIQPAPTPLRIHHRPQPMPRREQHGTSDKFFAELSFVEAALREAAQNAIDAVDGEGKPALAVDVLRLRQSQQDALARLHADSAHWAAAHGGLPLPGHSRKALVISDFGGSGLTGDARAIGAEQAGRLGAFWRSSGRSNKTDVGATGGRFGIGKDTFLHASGSRTFIALSLERCGRRRILGLADLGTRTTPNGDHWTDVSDIGGGIDPATGLTMPLEGPDADAADRLLGLGALRAKTAATHGLADAGVSIAILDPPDLPEGTDLATFVRKTLGPLLAIGRLRLFANGEEIRADDVRETDGLNFDGTTARPQELGTLVLDGEWEDDVREWAAGAGADPTRPFRVTVLPEGRNDLAAMIVVVPRSQHQKTAWYGIRRGALILKAPQGCMVDGATILMDVRGSRISEILAYAEGPSHSRWEMQQARRHYGRSRQMEREMDLVFRILGLPKTIWNEVRRKETREDAVVMDGFAADLEALLGPIPTSGRAPVPQGRPGSSAASAAPSAGNLQNGKGRNGRGGELAPGSFHVEMERSGRLRIFWNRPDGRLHLVAAPSHRRIPVDLVASSEDGSATARWDRESGVLEIRRTGTSPAVLTVDGWPSDVVLLVKRSAT